MNQQTLMAALSAYPAPKASDELLWRILTQVWLDAEPEQQTDVEQRPDGEGPCAQSVMAKNLEKILSTTRSSWSVRSPA